MFDDRSKTGYDFNKLDKLARTTVITEEKKKAENSNMSDAYKKLLSELEKSRTEEKQNIKEDIIKHTKNTTALDDMPSSAYLKSFENQVITYEENEEENKQEILNSQIEFDNLIEEAQNVEISNIPIKEVKKATKPKKNYSFRIKLVAGVYCIVVALFGGWVIGNTINISQINSAMYETSAKTSEINANIFDIVSDIKNLDNASGNPEDETLVVKIVTEEIEITPEAITQPNEYKQSSNWFDVLCNWISGLFGGGK